MFDIDTVSGNVTGSGENRQGRLCLRGPRRRRPLCLRSGQRVPRAHILSRRRRQTVDRIAALGARQAFQPGSPQCRWQQIVFEVGNPTGGPNEFAISNLDGTERKVLASNPRVSISEVLWTPPPRVPYAAIAVEGKPVITYLDDDKYARALKSLNATFSDHFITPDDMSADGATIIIGAVSDSLQDPGTYALFDAKTNKRAAAVSTPALDEGRPVGFAHAVLVQGIQRCRARRIPHPATPTARRRTCRPY